VGEEGAGVDLASRRLLWINVGCDDGARLRSAARMAAGGTEGPPSSSSAGDVGDGMSVGTGGCVGDDGAGNDWRRAVRRGGCVGVGKMGGKCGDCAGDCAGGMAIGT